MYFKHWNKCLIYRGLFCRRQFINLLFISVLINKASVTILFNTPYICTHFFRVYVDIFGFIEICNCVSVYFKGSCNRNQ